MVFRTPKLVKRTRHGIELQLGAEEPQLLGGLVAEMRELLRTDDDPSLRRLYPTAYPDDPEREAEYQILARTELADHRQQVLDPMGGGWSPSSSTTTRSTPGCRASTRSAWCSAPAWTS